MKINQLVLASLLASSAVLPGCIFVEESDKTPVNPTPDANPNPTPDANPAPKASIGFAWAVKSNNTAVTCPPGYDTTRTVVVPHGDTSGANKIVDLFNCADRAGRTAPIPPGQYDAWLEITSHDGTAIYAQSTPVYIDLTTADKDVSFDIHTDKGYYFTNWTLKGASTNAALTCSQVPTLTKISLDATGGTNPKTEFDCLQSAGYTSAFAIGLYQVAVAAIDAQARSLGQSATFANKQIEAPNKVTNLGTSLLLIDNR